MEKRCNQAVPSMRHLPTKLQNCRSCLCVIIQSLHHAEESSDQLLTVIMESRAHEWQGHLSHDEWASTKHRSTCMRAAVKINTGLRSSAADNISVLSNDSVGGKDQFKCIIFCV